MATAGFLGFSLCCVLHDGNVHGDFFTGMSGARAGWVVGGAEAGWASRSLSAQSRPVRFFSVWWALGSQTAHSSWLLPEHVFQGRQSKAPRDLALEIPECHFCTLLSANCVAKASQP